MTIGQKIKFIRTFKKIPQKEIGTALGFAPHTTEIRMSQYENIPTRAPKKEMLIRMAELMSVSQYALLEKYGNDIINIIMNAFWLELELYLYAEKNNVKHQIETTDFLSSIIPHDNQPNDLLALAIKEIHEHKKMLNETNQNYNAFINYMLTWADTSEIAQDSLNDML